MAARRLATMMEKTKYLNSRSASPGADDLSTSLTLAIAGFLPASSAGTLAVAEGTGVAVEVAVAVGVTGRCGDGVAEGMAPASMVFGSGHTALVATVG